MLICGLDLSLTGTGVCIWSEKELKEIDKCNNSKITLCEPFGYVRYGMIKTKLKDYKNSMERIFYIIENIQKMIDTEPKEIDLFLIEDYFIGRGRGSSSIDLIELGSIVRSWIYQNGGLFVTAVQSQLKKFTTGKGVGDKGLVMMKLFKKFGIETNDNNSADACSAALLGACVNKSINDKEYLKLFDKSTTDVIKNVCKNRSFVKGV